MLNYGTMCTVSEKSLQLAAQNELRENRKMIKKIQNRLKRHAPTGSRSESSEEEFDEEVLNTPVGEEFANDLMAAFHVQENEEQATADAAHLLAYKFQRHESPPPYKTPQ